MRTVGSPSNRDDSTTTSALANDGYGSPRNRGGRRAANPEVLGKLQELIPKLSFAQYHEPMIRWQERDGT